MGGSIRAYRCTGPEGVGTEPGTGVTIRETRGSLLATTVARALALRGREEYGSGWPLRVFELRIEIADVLVADDGGIRARAHRIEREVPLGEVLGPRAREITAHLAQVHHLPGDAAQETGRIAELIREHHTALADYAPVTLPPARTLRSWPDVRDAHQTVRVVTPPITAAVKVSCSAPGGTTAEHGAGLVQQAAARVAYFRTWDAVWQAAQTSAAKGLEALPGVRDPRGAGDAEHALGVAREPARAAAWELALHVLTQAPRPIAAPGDVYREAVAAAQTTPALRWTGDFVTLTAVVTWRLAMAAAFHASWRAAYLLNEVTRRDPWRPLIDLWSLGAWPLGSSNGSFMVFVPEPRS
jgi:hypothetical protein